ncbi:MAG: ethanolamine utilization protein EutN/carboxysome structural protein CcmL [uncultured bacterium]|nr:MAG: ethanolamine utilization protein EutN/carboxysome structural protein CcmL [uncultured bacterium]
MQLAKVIGTVVATTKDPALTGLKIMMIQPLTDSLKNSGGPIAAIDVVQAGVGDLVHWVTAREAALALPDSFVAVDAAITGIVDQVNSSSDGIKDKREIFESN